LLEKVAELLESSNARKKKLVSHFSVLVCWQFDWLAFWVLDLHLVCSSGANGSA